MVCQKMLVDELPGWLRIYDDGSVDRTWTGPSEVQFMTEPEPPHEEFVDGVATHDVVVNKKSGLKLRIYRPEVKPGDETKLPIILHFHGGGFCISQADWYMYYHMYTNLARSTKAICVSVYLRLAPEHRLPAAINDGCAALFWLRSQAQAESYEPWLVEHADFSRVFLIGDSTGGNLVHEVAARAGRVDLSPLRLAGAIPIHPCFVREEKNRSEPESALDKFLSLSLPFGCSKDHPITCPMGSRAPLLESLKLPPFLLCVAERDMIVDTEIEYYEAMKKAKKDVELLISPGMTHSFYLNKFAIDRDPQTAAQTQSLISRITEFVKKH